MFTELLSILRGKKSNQTGVGGKGEDAAVKFLCSKGYKILEQNWYNRRGKRLGEIDIIAKMDDLIIFVEVKSRYIGQKQRTAILSGKASVRPDENITPQKLKKLAKIAEVYIKEKDLWDKNWRIDGVSVIYTESDQPEIRHLESIFF